MIGCFVLRCINHEEQKVRADRNGHVLIRGDEMVVSCGIGTSNNNDHLNSHDFISKDAFPT
jgi:hypothetical protein